MNRTYYIGTLRNSSEEYVCHVMTHVNHISIGDPYYTSWESATNVNTKHAAENLSITYWYIRCSLKFHVTICKTWILTNINSTKIH